MTNEEFLESTPRIGFMRTFPVFETLETWYVPIGCLGYKAELRLRHCRLSINENLPGITVQGLVTDDITEVLDLRGKLYAGGFNSHAHLDEIAAMRRAVLEICEREGFEITEEYCSWPFVKVRIGSSVRPG